MSERARLAARPGKTVLARVGTAVRWGVLVALIGWLIHVGALDLEKLQVLLDRPTLLVMAPITWVVCWVLLPGLRWRLVLRGTGVAISVREALEAQLIAQFANTAVPSGFAGDVLKGLELARTRADAPVDRVLACVAVDRALALAGVALAALLCAPLDLRALQADPTRRAIVLGTLAAAVVAALLVVLAPDREALKLHRFGRLGRLLDAVPRYIPSRAILGASLVLSALPHIVAIGLFYEIARDLSPAVIAYNRVAALFPLGALLTAVLPFTPAGLGIGHATFEVLFRGIGLANGANVFNVYAFALIPLNLLGAFAYARSAARRSAGDKSGAT